MINRNIRLKNENGMVSEIMFNNLGTSVSFGFDPSDVEFVGVCSLDTFRKIVEK